MKVFTTIDEIIMFVSVLLQRMKVNKNLFVWTLILLLLVSKQHRNALDIASQYGHTSVAETIQRHCQSSRAQLVMKWSERPGQRDRARASESAGRSNITGQLWVGDAFAMEEEYACRSFVTNAVGIRNRHVSDKDSISSCQVVGLALQYRYIVRRTLIASP
jgi:hypothetical protein